MFGLAGCWTTSRCRIRHEKCPAFGQETSALEQPSTSGTPSCNPLTLPLYQQNQLLIEEQTSFCRRCSQTFTTSLRRTFKGRGGPGGRFPTQNNFFDIFLAGQSVWPLLCSHFVFLRDVWIRTERAAVTCRRATNIAILLPTQPSVSLLGHPSPYLATHLTIQPPITNNYCC